MSPRTVRWVVRVGVLVSLTALLGVGWVRSDEGSPAEKARLKKLDSGLKAIDVTKYPDDMKAIYPLFAKKCSKCHVVARAINTRFVLPGEWERYIKRMMYKPDSKLEESDAKSIYRFLAYDSSVRKADSLRVHLANLSEEDREAALEKIRALNPGFKATAK